MERKEQIPKSYQRASGKWVPKLVVRAYSGNDIHEQPFEWDKEFNTKEEADAFAKANIDRS